MPESEQCCTCGGALSEKTVREIKRLNRLSDYFNAKAMCDPCWEKAYPELVAKQRAKKEKKNESKISRKKTASDSATFKMV